MSFSPVFQKIEFEVTLFDWQHGFKARCTCCPVALAIRRKYPGLSVYVRDVCAYVGGVQFSLCTDTQRLIETFDHHDFSKTPEEHGITLPFLGQGQRLTGV